MMLTLSRVTKKWIACKFINETELPGAAHRLDLIPVDSSNWYLRLPGMSCRERYNNYIRHTRRYPEAAQPGDIVVWTDQTMELRAGIVWDDHKLMVVNGRVQIDLLTDRIPVNPN